MPPNVVLLVVDTVRRDRVSCYGYDEPTTPSLDAFAGDATRFTDPIVQGSWSVPSHASLFTGQYPSEHGATVDSPILQGAETFPELLQAAGYETRAISPNEYVRPRTGFGRGFDEFRTTEGLTVPSSLVELAAPAINAVTGSARIRRPVERAFNAIRNPTGATLRGDEGQGEQRLDGLVDATLADADEPFFLFVNLADAHLPRSPAPHHYEAFVDDELHDVEVVANERAHVFGDVEMDDRALGKLDQLYDADLATMDEHFGAILHRLRAHDVLEDSLVVVVSDHGEHLGEFDLVGHQHSVLDDVVSVPLVVQFPGQERGRVVDEQVEARRVFHTILDSAGVREYPERSLASGRGDALARGAFYSPMLDLGALLWDGAIEYDPSLLGEPLAFARDGEYKLVTHAGEEWLLEVPERENERLDPAEHEDVYRRLTGEKSTPKSRKPRTVA